MKEIDLSLLKAARNGTCKEIKDLLNAGANVDAQNENGYTALMLAALLGRDEIMPPLLRAGADVYIQNKHDRTAFHCAKYCAGDCGNYMPLILLGVDVSQKQQSTSSSSRSTNMGTNIGVTSYHDDGIIF